MSASRLDGGTGSQVIAALRDNPFSDAPAGVGGIITGDSAQRSRFRVTRNAGADTDLGSCAAANPLGAQRASPVCILLVEDKFLIREVARVVLEEAGYEVLDAEHGEQACDHLDRHTRRFTGLVTDYHMRGSVHGAELITRLRPAYPTIPIILASAFPHATTPEWRRLHAVNLLAKPYEPDDLVKMIRALMH